MSADNFIAIIKKGRSYIGYHCCASQDYPFTACFPCLGGKMFQVGRLLKAIDLAQSENTEYGYSIYDWNEETDERCPCETKRFIQEAIDKISEAVVK